MEEHKETEAEFQLGQYPACVFDNFRCRFKHIKSIYL